MLLAPQLTFKGQTVTVSVRWRGGGSVTTRWERLSAEGGPWKGKDGADGGPATRRGGGCGCGAAAAVIRAGGGVQRGGAAERGRKQRARAKDRAKAAREKAHRRAWSVAGIAIEAPVDRHGNPKVDPAPDPGGRKRLQTTPAATVFAQSWLQRGDDGSDDGSSSSSEDEAPKPLPLPSGLGEGDEERDSASWVWQPERALPPEPDSAKQVAPIRELPTEARRDSAGAAIARRNSLLLRLAAERALELEAEAAREEAARRAKELVPVRVTTRTWVLPRARFCDAGVYRCLVTNAFGSAWSQPFVLAVDAPATVRSKPPAKLSVYASESLTLRVATDGTPPLTHMWEKDCLPFACTLHASELRLDCVSKADAGRYRCVVSNEFGIARSAECTVSVEAWAVPKMRLRAASFSPRKMTRALALPGGLAVLPPTSFSPRKMTRALALPGGLAVLPPGGQSGGDVPGSKLAGLRIDPDAPPVGASAGAPSGGSWMSPGRDTVSKTASGTSSKTGSRRTPSPAKRRRSLAPHATSALLPLLPVKATRTRQVVVALGEGVAAVQGGLRRLGVGISRRDQLVGGDPGGSQKELQLQQEQHRMHGAPSGVWVRTHAQALAIAGDSAAPAPGSRSTPSPRRALLPAATGGGSAPTPGSRAPLARKGVLPVPYAMAAPQEERSVVPGGANAADGPGGSGRPLEHVEKAMARDERECYDWKDDTARAARTRKPAAIAGGRSVPGARAQDGGRSATAVQCSCCSRGRVGIARRLVSKLRCCNMATRCDSVAAPQC